MSNHKLLIWFFSGKYHLFLYPRMLRPHAVRCSGYPAAIYFHFSVILLFLKYTFSRKVCKPRLKYFPHLFGADKHKVFAIAGIAHFGIIRRAEQHNPAVYDTIFMM